MSFTEEPCALCGAGAYVASRRINVVEICFGAIERHITKWSGEHKNDIKLLSSGHHLRFYVDKAPPSLNGIEKLCGLQ